MAKPAAPVVDLELKRAFAELQQKMQETAQKLKLADLQIDGLMRTVHHSKLTQEELELLPEEIKTYEGVGRMFILTPASEVQDHLKAKSEKSEKKIKTLEENKAYLQRSLKESENNLREMVQQRKDMLSGQ